MVLREKLIETGKKHRNVIRAAAAVLLIVAGILTDRLLLLPRGAGSSPEQTAARSGELPAGTENETRQTEKESGGSEAPAQQDTEQTAPGEKKQSREETKPQETPWTDESGKKYRGWTELDGKTYYFREDGTPYRGWREAGGGFRRYFGEDGVLYVGEASVDGCRCFFDERGLCRTGRKDGRYYLCGYAAEGLTELNGRYFFFEDGFEVSGWRKVGDALYCFGGDNAALTGWQNLNGDIYYFAANGVMATGVTYIDGKTFCFAEGGEMVRNASYGRFDADENGVCTDRFPEVTPENAGAYADYLLSTITAPEDSPEQVLYGIYSYIRENYSYHYQPRLAPWTDTSEEEATAMTIRMFNDGRGACFDFAYATRYLLQRAGFSARVVTGPANASYTNEHDWVLVECEPGVWRHMDSMQTSYEIFLLTDEEMSAIHDPYVHFVWDHELWTSSTPDGTGGVNPADDPKYIDPHPHEMSPAADETAGAEESRAAAAETNTETETEK